MPDTLDRREFPRAGITGRREPEGHEPETRNDFAHLLRSLLQQTVTVVNSESYEEAPVGYRICVAFHRAKLIYMGADYIVLAGQFTHRGKSSSSSKEQEPISHYIPISRIKRVSILKSNRLIHI